MSNGLFEPRYIALDSYQLGEWARDHFSERAADRTEAAAFERWLELNGWIPLFCIHHIEELINHNDDSVALKRLRFIGNMNLVSWINNHENCIGGIVTLLAEEVRAAVQNPNSGISAIRDTAKSNIIQVGNGKTLLLNDPDAWLELRAEFASQAKKSREIVALSRLRIVDLRKKPISDLLKGRIRKGNDLRYQLELISKTIAVNIYQKGDRMIENPREVAEKFTDEIAEMGLTVNESAAELVMRLLAIQGVTAEDIKPYSTVGSLLDLGLFRRRLNIASTSIGIPYSVAVGTVRPEQIPSWQISKALEMYTPDVPERKGSEIIDGHLFCLSPYANVTLVDKRTYEAFRRLRRKDPKLANLVGRVEFASNYRAIPALLGTT